MYLYPVLDYVNIKDAILLVVEDLHFLSKDNLEKFISYRPIYSGLTWNTTNCLAGGSHESGKLTAFGKKVIFELEKNHILVDTAHLNEDSFSDVLKYTTKPVFCSHTAFYGLNAHSRNFMWRK